MINPTPANGPYCRLSSARYLTKPSTPDNQHTYLFYEQLPVDAHGGLLILSAVFSQTPRQLAHPLKTVSSVQQILDILRHNLRDISKLIVHLVEVLRRPAILVQLLRALDKRVEFDKGIGPQSGRQILRGRVRRSEFGGDIGKICEGKLARIRLVAYAKKANIVFD